MPQEEGHEHGGAAKQQSPAGFHNPLPVGTQDSALGRPQNWPETLQACSHVIATFPYPAAIFYGEEFAIFCNKAWADIAGVERQGQAQRGNLKPDAWKALSAALQGGIPKRVVARELLRIEESGEKQRTAYSPVLLSPIFSNDNDDVDGVLAQLIPEGSPPGSIDGTNDTEIKQSSAPDKNRATQVHQLDISELGKIGEEFPLDEHPFFHRFAEMLPTGLAILDHRAQAVFVNQQFYQLTTHHKEDKEFKSWPQSIHPEDFDRVMAAYQDAFTSQKRLRTEFRAVVESANPWRLLLLTPLGDENLRHVSLREYGGFICSIVDISSQKSAELSERKAAKKARERKEQQERFIDMISHEIRNPLSAILHCTEDIDEAVQKPNAEVDVAAIKEALETIQLCITHQKNIVDDVLSFSKLDASMLSLAPKACQPSDQLGASMKIFQPEFRKQSMEFRFQIDQSYVNHGIDYVMADMARIGQVVINLVSNAIKFTSKKEGKKSITVSVGASDDRPTSYPPNVVYFNSDDLAFRMDATNNRQWGVGNLLYIMVAVKDSGIGISEEGQRRLFERFRQATPKTAEEYGGSGLGLNISRKICHMHGGEIGVASEEGSGSTFGFFFKVKRTTEPKDQSEAQKVDKTIESDDLKKQAEKLGNRTGATDEEDEKVPESIQSPPVVDDHESTPYPDGDATGKYSKTSQVASRVKEPEADEYANSARPKVSAQHRTGSHLQSAELEKKTSHQDDWSTGANEKDDIPKQHILLVEDNVINQKIVFRKLETKGFNVTTANNGREAVEAIRKAPRASGGNKHAFTVVLMDQEMPILDGNSATKHIRRMEKDGAIEHIPIIGLTANVRGAQLQEMLDNGMDDVISKPYKIEELIEKIGNITASASKN